MIIQRMHHEIKLRYNKLNSNHKKDLPPALIDDIINDAQDIYVEIFYSGNNLKQYKLGFEVTRQRIDMLSSLVEKPVNSLIPIELREGLYEIPFSMLKSKYKHLIRAYSKTNCGIVNIQPIQHDDLNKILNDPLRGPSKTWRKLISATGRSTDDGDNSSLFIYSEPNFNVLEVWLEYIKQPRRVFFGGYNSMEFIQGDMSSYNEEDNPINSELPENYHTVLVDLAVQELARILEDGERFQLKKEKILANT